MRVQGGVDYAFQRAYRNEDVNTVDLKEMLNKLDNDSWKPDGL